MDRCIMMYQWPCSFFLTLSCTSVSQYFGQVWRILLQRDLKLEMRSTTDGFVISSNGDS